MPSFNEVLDEALISLEDVLGMEFSQEQLTLARSSIARSLHEDGRIDIALLWSEIPNLSEFAVRIKRGIYQGDDTCFTQVIFSKRKEVLNIEMHC